MSRSNALLSVVALLVGDVAAAWHRRRIKCPHTFTTTRSTPPSCTACGHTVPTYESH